MPIQRPLILLSCDDGIRSPGLHAAAEAVADLGDLLICAPCEQQSGAGRSLPSYNDGVIHTIEFIVGGQPVPAYAIKGSPAQAVLYALVELVPHRPSLCVSGINYGENVGTRVSSSGTVGAALEAADNGVPSLAVSLETEKEYHYNPSAGLDLSASQSFARRFAHWMLDGSLPFDVDVLKVDVPCDATPHTPWRVTRLSRQHYFRALPSGRQQLHERKRLDYEVAIDFANLEPDSDVYALQVDRIVSVTPISLDLTSRTNLQGLEDQLRT
jgi:5'-nucleotidase